MLGGRGLQYVLKIFEWKNYDSNLAKDQKEHGSFWAHTGHKNINDLIDIILVSYRALISQSVDP